MHQARATSAAGASAGPELQKGRSLKDDWLAQRHHLDLDPRAERALRAAGLSWQDEAEAERHLADARALAPGHRAVTIAHYRYYLYKHRFDEAEQYARACLRHAAEDLGLPADVRAVTRAHADFTRDDPALRFWLYGVQAYGYVLLRCARREEGLEVLQKLVELDPSDQTKTRILLDVITRPPSE